MTKHSEYDKKTERDRGVAQLKKANKHYVFAAFGLAASIGLNMVACIIAGMAAGRFMDGFFDTYPWITITGIVFGMLAGLWATYKKITSLEK